MSYNDEVGAIRQNLPCEDQGKSCLRGPPAAHAARNAPYVCDYTIWHRRGNAIDIEKYPMARVRPSLRQGPQSVLVEVLDTPMRQSQLRKQIQDVAHADLFTANCGSRHRRDGQPKLFGLWPAPYSAKQGI